jgi:hypothetical protein
LQVRLTDGTGRLRVLIAPAAARELAAGRLPRTGDRLAVEGVLQCRPGVPSALRVGSARQVRVTGSAP